MPITKLQFEMGIDGGIESLMVALYDFLIEHQETAYAEEELYQQFGVSDPGTYIDTSHLDIALQKVVETGAVEARSVANSTYYAFLQGIDKATWKPPADSADETGGDSESETPTSE
jgi:hypothetical protein